MSVPQHVQAWPGVFTEAAFGLGMLNAVGGSYVLVLVALGVGHAYRRLFR